MEFTMHRCLFSSLESAPVESAREDALTIFRSQQRKKERMREEMRLGRTSSEAVVSSPDSPPQ